MEVLVRFYGGEQDGHFIPLPDSWDVEAPPEVVWLLTEFNARGMSTYRLLDEAPGCAYRFSGEAGPELHYERFVQADKSADLHSG